MKKTLLQALPMLFVGLLFALQSMYAQTNYYVNSVTGNDGNAGTNLSPKKSIQAALDLIVNIPVGNRDVNGYIVNISAGTYNETVIVKTPHTTLRGSGSGAKGKLEADPVNAALHTVISGVGLGASKNGISFSGALTDVTIEDLVVSDFSSNGINSLANSDRLVIRNVQANNNGGQGGILVVGPVKDVVIENSAAINNAGRAIVVWNGFKERITIQHNYVVLGGCCGIELQDGTASGVNVNNNTVIGTPSNGDSGISALGLKAGAGANIIHSNKIDIAKRYGIEIKNPAGSGADNEADDGAIILRNNEITRTGVISENRDLAGIAVFRRAFSSGNPDGYVNVPSGVVVKNNTISGFQQLSADGEGYGVVVEGVRMTVTGNTISSCDVGVQRQAGNASNYVKNNQGDADQLAAGSLYFNRGNSPFSSAILVGSNSFSSNGLDTRDEFAPLTYFGDAQFVYNSNTSVNYASINLAVEYATAGNTLQLSQHTFDELVVVDKALTIDGVDKLTRKLTYTGAVLHPTDILLNPQAITPALFKVAAKNVVIKNLSMEVDLAKISSAVITSGDGGGLTLLNNNIKAVTTSVTYSSGYGFRNAVAANLSGLTILGVTNAVNPSGLITLQGNNISYSLPNNPLPAAVFRAGVAVDNYNVIVGGDNVSDGNTIASVNHDVTNRFQTTAGQSVVKNNVFNGGGIEFSEPNAPFGGAVFEKNDFNYTLGAPTAFALVRLKNNNANKPFVFKDNQVRNNYWLVSLENFQNVEVEGNTFTPVKDANDYFQIISVNTKTISSSSNTKLPLSATIVGNVFNGANGSVNSKGIAFYNHDNASPQYGSFTIGAVGKPNTFNDNIVNYLYVDNSNGAQTKNGANTALAGYPEYGGSISQTITGYWTLNLRADENQFFIDGSLRSPFAMTAAQRLALDGRIFDKKDDSNIGEVQYYFPVTNLTTGLKYSGIQSAIDAASAGNEITTLPGEYLEDVQINKSGLKLIGPGADLATIKGVKGGSTTTLSIAANGAVAEGFTVTREGNNAADWNNANGALNMQGVSMDADNTVARKLIVTGNRNGVYINNRKNVLVEHCDISNNRTGLQVANNVTGSIIRNNNITNNWTMGFLYIDPSDPVNGVGAATSLDVIKNKITGNWYSQIEFRTNNIAVLNFGANDLGQGAGEIDVTVTPSGEPGYAAQIPVVFGGTATAPPTAQMICGIYSAKVDYSASLPAYVDGDPGIGFQPDSAVVWLREIGPLSARLTNASRIVANNGTILAKSLILNGGGKLSKDVTLTADAATLTLNGDVAVEANLIKLLKATTVSGLFTLTAGKVTPSAAFVLNGGVSTVAAPTNFIDGLVTVGNVSADVLVPVGKGTKAAYVGLFGITGTASTFDVEYFPTAYGSLAKDVALTSVSGLEYWSVNRASGSASAKVRLYTFDLAGSGLLAGALPDAVVAHYNSVGAKWESLGSSAYLNATPSYVAGNLQTSDFGSFTFGTVVTVLPVSLIDFSAVATTGGALLKWRTANEENNLKFEVEKSLDGKTFVVIGERYVKGSASTISPYEFLDVNFRQSAYYRLVQVDAAGGARKVYGDLLRFVKGLDNELSVVAYPNPVTAKLYVNTASTNRESVKLLLSDLTGKPVVVKTGDGTGPIEIDVAGLAAGSYVLQVIKSSGNVTKKILKL